MRSLPLTKGTREVGRHYPITGAPFRSSQQICYQSKWIAYEDLTINAAGTSINSVQVEHDGKMPAD